MTGAFPSHDRHHALSRSNPNSADGDSSDRTTTPGVGEDSRATLPEPLPPVHTGRDLGRTIPMGSSQTAEWSARLNSVGPQQSNTSRSGVHAMPTEVISDAPVGPVTKSDRVPAQRFTAPAQPTLRSLGAALPSTTEADGKRLIGSADLGRTFRVMTVPPPAASAPRGSSAPPPLKSSPITPAPTIRISPEISIPTQPEVRVPQQPSTAVVTPPTVERAPSVPEAAAHAEPLQLSPEVHARQSAAPPSKPVAPTPVSASSPARRWPFIVGAVVLTGVLAVVAASVWFAGTARPIAVPVAAEPIDTPPPAPVDLRPATEFVTNPPGAEIVLRGALIANTPARITRPPYESLYLVRLHGYQPQLVALSMHSPDTIHIDLQPIAPTP